MTQLQRAAARPTEVVALDLDGYVMAIPDLAALILDSVAGGASVNFMAGVTEEEAAAWWRERIPQIADGTITAFIARRRAADDGTEREAGTAAAKPEAGAVIGSTLLIRSRSANSPHRAEIAKVLVHSSARRRGLGRALMEAAEARARADGRWLLILDTEAGSDADFFYRSIGWQELGTMPNHAYRSNGVLAPTTYFWKDLRG